MFLHEPAINDKNIYLANVSVALKTIVAFGVIGTLGTIFMFDFVTQFISNLVFNSGF